MTHSETRGKVQLFLSSILPINDQSGVKSKSVINQIAPLVLDRKLDKAEAKEPLNILGTPFVRQKDYIKLKELEKFLRDPAKIFFDEDPNENQENQDLWFEEEETTKESAKKVKQRGRLFDRILAYIVNLLEYFKSEGTSSAEQEYIVPKFPKTIFDLATLPIQLKDFHFRHHFLLQILIFVVAVQNHVTTTKLKLSDLEVEENVSFTSINFRFLESFADKS